MSSAGEVDQPAAAIAKEEGEDETTKISQAPSRLKLVFQSVWQKRKPLRWRRSVNLEKQRSQLKLQEHALVEPAGGSLRLDTSDPATCVCIKYSQNSAAHLQTNMANHRDVLEAKEDGNRGPSVAGSNHEAVGSNPTRANYQVDYINYLIPRLRDIFSCPFYWGKMDRFEAEALLADKPEGSFLLRDSAQDDYVFSVSFRRYSRSLHARIEETGHTFSFDCHDPGVHASRSIRGLLDHYKDPLSCMFFEPMLLFPVLRKSAFSLQELARTVICDNMAGYNEVSQLPIPQSLQDYLREYHYKHKLESRSLEVTLSTRNRSNDG